MIRPEFFRENIGTMLRRFKKSVERAGILTDLRRTEFYRKPSVRRRIKSAAARKRRAQ